MTGSLLALTNLSPKPNPPPSTLHPTPYTVGMNDNPEELADERLAFAAMAFGSVAAIKCHGGLVLLFTRDQGVDEAQLMGKTVYPLSLNSVIDSLAR